MNTSILKISPLFQDLLTTAGIVSIFTILGFYSHEFASVLQTNLFMGDWGLF